MLLQYPRGEPEKKSQTCHQHRDSELMAHHRGELQHTKNARTRQLTNIYNGSASDSPTAHRTTQQMHSTTTHTFPFASTTVFKYTTCRCLTEEDDEEDAFAISARRT